MLSEKQLDSYAELIIKLGVNLQKGQGVNISCPVECAFAARLLMKKAYECGASIVRITWHDDESERITYNYATENALKEIPKWQVDSKNYLVKNGFVNIAVDADDPNAFAEVDSKKINARSIALGNAHRKFQDAIMGNAIRWCVMSVPSEKWAKTVFPKSTTPVDDLWDAIALTMRLNEKDPFSAWQKHVDKLERRAAFLNKMNFEYLRYINALGTDLKVGLCINHNWCSALEKGAGKNFIANMPTEEVYTAPHKYKTEGTLKGALPLVANGKIIDDFYMTFKKGKIIDYGAKKGYDALKSVIETDKGTLYLGEVALIGKNSPIAKSKTLFYNTLFDENASCHLAVGKGYPSTVKNGTSLSKKELSNLGLNDSIEHCDFMIGTPDLNITGIGFDGKETAIFKDGEWVID